MRYALRMALFAALLALAVAGCKKKEEQPQPSGEMASPHGMGVKKNQPVVVPDSVKGKWKAVKIAVTDKTVNKTTEYTVPLGSRFAIPNTGLTLSVDNFLPQFTIGSAGLTSLSNDPKNPAVQATISEGGNELFKGWLFAAFPQVHAFQHPKYTVLLVAGVPAG